MQISGLSASNSFSATDVLAIEVNVNGVNKTYKMTGATLATALASIGSYLNTTDVVNNLTSTATDKPLSANMGKALNDKFTSVTIDFPSETYSGFEIKSKVITNEIPSGYKPISIMMVRTGTTNILFASLLSYPSLHNYYAQIFNAYSQSITDTYSIIVYCIKV